ncbi:peroxiredoxin-like 2C [Antennarius striatus]|uniref:peroxiredoxin-like 2C n=1 Tax=Antennarius striatus TaxID=241820 RepID=UPI0035B1FED6
MADGEDSSANSYVKALTVFTENGNALLDFAEKECREGTLQDFIRQKIRIDRQQSLLGLIEAGAALYRSLSVQKKKDAEELWRKNNHSAALRVSVQEFQKLEMRWDSFLQRLDDDLEMTPNRLDGGHQSKYISAETPLINARTGERTTLKEYLGKSKKILLVLIRQFSCLLCRLHLKDLQKNQMSLDTNAIQVVVVSFGCQVGASHWLQETDCQYDMLLDSDRKLYEAFGLGASVKKVLNFSNMLLYAEYVADNMEFPRNLPSIQDDMFQLGGDFVLNKHGRVLFSYCCQSPIDRPSVDDILSTLRR